jgi:perosamine synthetase
MKVPYFVPWITKDDKNSVQKALSQRWLTSGPYLQKFEKKFCNVIKTKFSCGVGSATHALHLSSKSLGIKPGDEVIVPSFTFAATANAVIYCGAKPIFADVDPETFNILPKDIEKKITKKTKAIIPVHYGGQSCDMNEIMKIAKKYRLNVIEDCAHALGSTYFDKKCGSIGEFGCFSFYPTKIITTGEGGMVTCKNPKLFKKINLFRSQALSISAKHREKIAQWKYDILDLGYNYRLDELRSSLGYSQISRLSEINKKRIKIASEYTKLINKINGIITPKIKPNRNHIFHLYTIKIEKDFHLSRDELFDKLQSKGIGTSVQYYPLHLMSYYKKNFPSKTPLPNSNLLKDTVLSLPIYPTMTLKQIKYVVSQIN